MSAALTDTSIFEPIIPLITEMRPPSRYISLRIPEGLELERDLVITYFENAELKFAGGRFTTLDGYVKDQVVFDYLYQQFDNYNAPV
jgi:hypothetical protein